MVGAELTGFTGGIDGNSVVLKNGVALQSSGDYTFTNTSVTILSRSFNDDEITVLNGGILDSIAGPFTFSDNVTFDGDINVLAGTGSNVLEVSTNADDESTVAVTGDLTVSGDTTLVGDVDGDGFDRSVVTLINQHSGGTADLHVHGTATSPGTVTDDGVDPLVTHLYQVSTGDYTDAIDYYTYDDTMVWRFTGLDVLSANNFVKGDYYATNGYFSGTEVESDTVVSGHWLLRCTERIQEAGGARRLIISFKVITNGLDVTVRPGDWLNEPSGSSQYILDSDTADLTTSASVYNLVRVDIANVGIITHVGDGDNRVADAEDIADSISLGSDEDRRHILNEIGGISGVPNSAANATRDVLLGTHQA